MTLDELQEELKTSKARLQDLTNMVLQQQGVISFLEYAILKEKETVPPEAVK